MNAVPNRSAVNREQTTVRPSDSADPKKVQTKTRPTNEHAYGQFTFAQSIGKAANLPIQESPSPRHGLYRKCPASASKAVSVGVAYFSQIKKLKLVPIGYYLGGSLKTWAPIWD